MKVEEKGHTIIIKDTEGNIQTFLGKVTDQHNSYKNHIFVLIVN